MTLVVNLSPVAMEASVGHTEPCGLSNCTTSLVTSTVTNYSHYSGLQSFELPASRILKYLTLVTYFITFICGAAGNGLVLYIIAHFSKIRRKSVANYYIWNLALADILFILTLPFSCYATLTNDWIFGDAVCKVSYFMKEVNKFASIFTLAALSTDRCFATYPALSDLRTIRFGKIVCAFIWIISCVIVIPNWLFASAISFHDRTSCRIEWPLEDKLMTRTAWTYFQLSIGFVLPLFVIGVSYCLLVVRLRRVTKHRQQTPITRPNKRLTKTVLVVVLIFLVCQAPYHAVEIISLKKTETYFLARQQGSALRPTPTDMILFMYLHFTATVLVFISSCCNPIIYGVYNENYRALYRIALRPCACARQTREPLSGLASVPSYMASRGAHQRPSKLPLSFV